MNNPLTTIKWDMRDIIAAVAVSIALVSFAFSLIQFLRAKHEEKIRALQGNKESVGYIAYKLSKGKLPILPKRRKDILMSLCLAAIFEGSGRSRTLIYSALKKAMEKHSDEVKVMIADIEKHFKEYIEIGITNLKKGQKRLKNLEKALEIKENSIPPKKADSNGRGMGTTVNNDVKP